MKCDGKLQKKNLKKSKKILFVQIFRAQLPVQSDAKRNNLALNHHFSIKKSIISDGK